ncbi:response regulator transcription factor [Spirosoma soli]|uniref:Response regulator transcription factor n=1 Tax=Spirosoma soli TaxID=1770529 RepID=A0ABW5M1N9_9BACT
MKTVTLPTYVDYLNLLAQQPQPSGWDYGQYLAEVGTRHLWSGLSSTDVFILDYSSKQYPFLSPDAKQVIGQPREAFVEGGLDFMLYHRHDFAVFSETIFPDEVRFIAQHQDEDLASFRFSKTYRFRNQEGHYRTILQRNTIISVSEQSTPIAIFGSATDITDFTEKGKIVHQIEQYDSVNQQWKLLLSKEYFPDIAPDNLLSKREIEIMKWAVEGYSSKQIADKLHVSFNTVNTHRRNMLRKTNCQNSLELLQYAIARKLL